MSALATPAAESWFAYIGLAAIAIAATFYGLRALATWANAEVQRMVDDALATEAADWAWADEAIALTEPTPTYDRLCFERWESEMGGGAR